MTDLISAHVPIDRRLGLVSGSRADGVVLFVDVVDFVALADRMVAAEGPRWAADRVTGLLNEVWAPIVGAIHRWRGSVVGLQGDGLLCWFDDGLRAVTCAGLLHQSLGEGEPDERPTRLRVAMEAGTVRRHLVGDPAIQRFDVLAGSLVDRVGRLERLARPGETVIGPTLLARLGGAVTCDPPAPADGAGVVAAVNRPAPPAPWPTAPASDRGSDPTFLPLAVAARIRRGDALLTDLRPVVTCFLGFRGLDHDRDPAAGQVLDRWVGHVQAVVDDHGGAILQVNTGDKGNAVLLAFGAPLSHEDDADRAVAVARMLCRSDAGPSGIAGVRAGISRGVMRAGTYGTVDRSLYTVMGQDANIAARLMVAARPGQILVTDRVARVVGRPLSTRSVGDLDLKGVTAPVATLEVLDDVAPSQIERAPVALVGHAGPRAALADRVAGLAAGGGGCVIVRGAPGSGKSTLVDSVCHDAMSSGVRVIRSSAFELDSTVLYHPWVGLVGDLLELQPDADAGVVGRRVAERLDPCPDVTLLGPVLDLDLRPSAGVVGLGPAGAAEGVRDLVVALVDAVASDQPLVLVIDNAQWMDSSSWALATRVAACKGSLLVLITRDGDDEPPAVDRVTALPDTTTVDLADLGADDLATVVARRLGVRQLPTLLSGLLAKRAGGNPMLAVELAAWLRERGLLHVADGVATVDARVIGGADLDLPDTLHGVVTSRIDQLEPLQQRCVKVASAFGTRAPVAALQALVDDDGMQGALDGVVEGGFLVRGGPAGRRDVVFAQPLVRDVAYQSMLSTQQMAMHRAIAEWYDQFAEAAPAPAQVAGHWVKAATGSTDTNVVTTALAHVRGAAAQAMGSHASPELAIHSGNALALLERDPDHPDRVAVELQLQAMRAFALMTVRGYGDPEVERAYRRAQDLAAVMPGSVQLGFILYGIFSFHASRGEYAAAQPLADRLTAVARELDDAPTAAVAAQSQGIVAFLRGDVGRGRDRFADSFARSEVLHDAVFAEFGGGFQAATGAWLALSTTVAGDPVKGAEMFRRALDIAADRPYQRGFVMAFGMVPQLLGDAQWTVTVAAELRELAVKYSFALLGSLAEVFSGWAEGQLEPGEDSVQLVRQGIALPRMARLDSCMPWYLAMLAETQLMAKDVEGARTTVHEGLAHASRTGDSYFRAELIRLDAIVMGALGEPAEAVTTRLRAAVGVARAHGSTWFELRAITELCRQLLHRPAGPDHSAGQRLAWLLDTHGSSGDLPDVRAARTVLNRFTTAGWPLRDPGPRTQSPPSSTEEPR